MNFGLLYELGVPSPHDARAEYQAYWQAVEQVRLAEEVGFTHVWAVEHHFLEEFSHCSAPEIWLATLAQHTKRIRLGHGVVLLPVPFNHPIRVAERIAALDIVSNGRIEFGIGRSITEQELGGFSIDPADSRPMMLESLELLQTVWSTDRAVSFDGRYLKMPPRKIVPRPLQKPYPPMWMACTSPSSYELAGQLGLGVLAFGMAQSPAQMQRRLNEYRRGLEQAKAKGIRINEQVAVFLMGFCDASMSAAIAKCRKPFTYYMDKTMEFFLHWGKGGTLPPGYEWYAEASAKSGVGERMKLEYLLENGMILCGDAEDIYRQAKGFADIGVDQILVGTQLGTMPPEETLRSIRRMGESLIPAFSRSETLPA